MLLDTVNYETFLKNGPNVWKVLRWMIIVGILMIVLSKIDFLRSLLSLGKINKDIFSLIGSQLLLAGAFFSGGGFIGFLFGIPRILQNTSLSDEDLKTYKSIILSNDNLVQISDWLTKIIVGLGLTHLNKIPGFLLGISNRFAITSFGITDSVEQIIIIYIIVYFIIVGFLSFYIWTRLHFTQLVKLNEKELKAELAEKKEELKEKNEELSVLTKAYPDVAVEIKSKKESIKNDPDLEDDPQKGKWGGRSTSNDRQVSAKVDILPNDPSLFEIFLEVISTNVNNPLNGEVVFYLHPSFKKNVRKVKAEDGKAKLRLISYGAFTVGIECDQGRTQLEIDLAKLSDAPIRFIEN